MDFKDGGQNYLEQWDDVNCKWIKLEKGRKTLMAHKKGDVVRHKHHKHGMQYVTFPGGVDWFSRGALLAVPCDPDFVDEILAKERARISKDLMCKDTIQAQEQPTAVRRF